MAANESISSDHAIESTDEVVRLTTKRLPEDWTELDQRAVDTARVLAADAVEHCGSGHPGTAMSLAPVAYALFQRVMRHDPNDAQWLGRDRFVLSAGHSSLTLYIQLFLSGYGLELDDLKALPTRSVWPWPPAASVACWTRTPSRAGACSTIRST